MAGMLEYKCPCCDGAIQFDSATQKMKCPYCDTEFDVDTLKGYDEELKDEKPSEMNWATPRAAAGQKGRPPVCILTAARAAAARSWATTPWPPRPAPSAAIPSSSPDSLPGPCGPTSSSPSSWTKKAAKAKLQEHLKGKTLLTPGVPQPEPYRRDQGRVCALLAL